MNKINPIVSLFDKNFKLNLDEKKLNTADNIESYIEDVKKNFFNAKHDISNFKTINSNINFKSVDDSTSSNFKSSSADEIQPNNGCIGLSYDIGIPPTNEILKTFHFKSSRI